MSKLRWLKVGAPLAGRFPRFFYALATAAGRAAYYVRPAARRRVIRNMVAPCNGDAARARREAVRVFQNAARYYVDLGTLGRRDMANFERDHMRLVNGDRLQVLSEPGPIIALGAHTGNSELAVQALTHRGRPFVALVEALRPPELSGYIIGLRSAAGGTFYEADFRGLRACLETLQSGGLVGLMGDRDLQGTGVCVTLFGRRVKLPRGPWELALRTQATVLPVFCARTSADNMVLYVEEPFRVPATGCREDDVTRAAQRWAGLLETHLRRAPGQWTVLEDFWRVHACGKG